MAPLKVLPDNPPEALRRTRREPRSAMLLPMLLTSGSGEKVPAVLLNLSASGLLVLVDVRFSPVLPPPPGLASRASFSWPTSRSAPPSWKSCGSKTVTLT